MAFYSSISMDDGCTLCTCEPWHGLECDSTACKPGQAETYSRNGMKDGEKTVWDGRSGALWVL